VKEDREFSWFKTLPDAVLIKVLDRLNSSVNPAPFFRLVIASDIPAIKDGELLHYPVAEFVSHADKWINTLSALIKGGWKEGSTNLKQVFFQVLAHAIWFTTKRNEKCMKTCSD
jgi:hypothetical protein